MAETLQELGEHIAAKLGAGFSVAFGELTLTAEVADILRVLTFLRDDPECGFRAQQSFQSAKHRCISAGIIVNSVRAIVCGCSEDDLCTVVGLSGWPLILHGQKAIKHRSVSNRHCTT